MASRSSTITELPNPHAGDVLAEDFLKPLSLSQSALARAIGVPPRRINEIVLGKRAVTADTDLRLARTFGLSDGFFLRLQASHGGAPPRTRTEAHRDQAQGGVKGGDARSELHRARIGGRRFAIPP